VNRTVLIIDDDVNLQIIAESLLSLRDLDVRVARGAIDASEILAKYDVGVAVVDLIVDGMNSFDLLRRLRDGSVPDLRIVVMTDRREPELERFARRLGANAVLRKPLDPGQFISTVEGLLESAAIQHRIAVNRS
jgi:DNA-binding NtrC family response regulator